MVKQRRLFYYGVTALHYLTFFRQYGESRGYSSKRSRHILKYVASQTKSAEADFVELATRFNVWRTWTSSTSPYR